jgi:hypothetical protein
MIRTKKKMELHGQITHLNVVVRPIRKLYYREGSFKESGGIDSGGQIRGTELVQKERK